MVTSRATQFCFHLNVLCKTVAENMFNISQYVWYLANHGFVTHNMSCKLHSAVQKNLCKAFFLF